MKIKSVFTLIMLFIAILGFQSCQPLLKAYSGVKTPELEMKNPDRLAYYEPFIESTNKAINIYAFNDVNALKLGFNAIKSYPYIILKNNNNNQLYRLNCYDDLDLFIEDINNENYEDLLEIEAEDLDKINNFIENNTKLVYTKNKSVDSMWNVYIVSGAFLGKKLRKKSLPITNIKALNKLIILDLSVNKN